MTDLRTDRTRGYLCEALMSLLREMPFEKVTVSAVAARAGVSRNSFYNHYSDPFALVEECYMRESPYFSGSFKRRRDYASRRDACTELLSVHAQGLLFFKANPNFAQVFLDNVCTSDRFSTCRAATENLLADHIETEYGGAARSYLTKDGCTRFVTWGIYGLMRSWFLGETGASVEASTKETIHFALQTTAGMAGHPIEPEYQRAINDWHMG